MLEHLWMCQKYWRQSLLSRDRYFASFSQNEGTEGSILVGSWLEALNHLKDQTRLERIALGTDPSSSQKRELLLRQNNLYRS